MHNASAEALMGQIVDEYLERLARDERPQVEEYTHRYPRLASVLRQMLPALEILRNSAVSEPRASGCLVSEIEPEGPLGDFRIVREIGRGGMGVVYEAVQISLGRRVALKVLPFAAALDAKQLQRFKNEAQAAAHLHHQHIVPVYAVGCERSVHFYAMQFIEGQTLAALIQELRQEPAAHAADTHRQAATLATAYSTGDPACFRAMAKLADQAAEALEHAHRRGVVHRDIKPANLLVDGQGNLWVTDFGLAQVQTDTRLTLSGDLVGTLRYMSPEQALAQPIGVDHRTDLYSLGATLYELLTLAPAFRGRDRQELLRQIAFEDPLPPRRIRKAVPAELEIIVLKAMAKDPAERYATAQELADDLRRYLEDKPIRARRPSWLEQGRKWTRRHKPVVWSAGLALLATLGVLAGSVGWVVRDRFAAQAKIASEIQGAVDEARRFHTEGKWPQGQAAARRAEVLLASAGAQVELRQSVRHLLAEFRMVERLEEIRILRCGVRNGHFNFEGGDREYAAAFRDYGIDVEALDSGSTAERIMAQAIRVELAAALDGWAQTRRWVVFKGEKSWQEILALARAADPDPMRRTLRDMVLRGDCQALAQRAASVEIGALPPATVVLLAEHLEGMGDLEAATSLLQRAQEQHPSDFWINHTLALSLSNRSTPQWDEAIRFYTAAVALRPESAGARLNFGNALAAKGRLNAALAAYRRAAELKPDYAEAHSNVGNAMRQMGRLDEALFACTDAINLKPELPEAHFTFGLVLEQKGRLDEAIFAYRRAVELKPGYAEAHNNLGSILGEVGRLDEAIAACRQAIMSKPQLAEAHYGLGLTLDRQGHPDEAIVAYRRAIALKPGYAEAHSNLGVALDLQGRPDEALTAYRQAVKLNPNLLRALHNLGLALQDKGLHTEAAATLRRLVDLEPESARAHYDLGNTLREEGQLDQAVTAYNRAIALEPDFAEAYCNLGCALRQQRQFARALAVFRRGHELGSRRPDWPYVSDRWVRECQRLDELQGRLRAFLRGEAEPANASERNALALHCYDQRRYLAAVRFWASALTTDPNLAADLETGSRSDAACAAAMAASGQGVNANQIDDRERVQLRKQAVQWLRADLAAHGKFLKNSQPKEHRLVLHQLRGWQREHALISLRDPAAVARLPADEQQACQKLWAEVKALLKMADSARLAEQKRPPR
jgi:tetratricopeptide (TPR) repeat protein